jgi:CRISPR-associated endonuclease Csy4
MDSYIDIKIRRDPEFATPQLMSALFAKLHKAFVQIENRGIGVSFPKAEPNGLGDVLRLHGSAGALQRLMELPWLVGIRDHIHLSSIEVVPVEVQYRQLQRIQAKSNPERLRRRAMRRHKIDAEEAAKRIPDSAVELVNLPYVRMNSTSTNQQFRVFIRQGPLLQAPVQGPFNAYGLSATATIPWF